MNLDDALACIEQYIRPGMTVEVWQAHNLKLVRRVIFNDGETYAGTPQQFAAAILAVSAIAEMPTTMDEFSERSGWTAERNTPDYAIDEWINRGVHAAQLVAENGMVGGERPGKD